MKTNLVEITVSADTGCGKTEVMKVISDALHSYYGSMAQVSSRELAEEERMATSEGILKDAKDTGQTAKTKNTVFVLYEEKLKL